jgi:two-component system response regulator FixJ
MPTGLILVVDDDRAVREATARLLKRAGYSVECFESGDTLLAADLPEAVACVLLDVRMPGTDGIGVLRALATRGWSAPVMVITGHGDIPLAVEAMRQGAFDFVEKPYAPEHLFAMIERAQSAEPIERNTDGIDATAELVVRSLSWRQRQVLAGILCGHPNKIIAYELGLSIRTVEAYRAQVLTKLRVRGTAEAVKFALAAGLKTSEFGASRPGQG